LFKTGKVFLNKKLDFEQREEYTFLTYAYDGFNLLERFSTIRVVDVDDELPIIVTSDNKNFNVKTNSFEFKVSESVSIGHNLNDPTSPFIFSVILFISSKQSKKTDHLFLNYYLQDLDTSLNALTIDLVDSVSGLATIPFALDKAGNLQVTSLLDFENRDEYVLKLSVKDTKGGKNEAIVHIHIVDEADEAPKFLIPQFNNHEVRFFEKTIGSVIEIKAVSQNRNPIKNITYKLKQVEPFEKRHNFMLAESGDTWFLNCTEKISLQQDGKEELFLIQIEAQESDQLFTGINLNVRVISGDVCE